VAGIVGVLQFSPQKRRFKWEKMLKWRTCNPITLSLFVALLYNMRQVQPETLPKNSNLPVYRISSLKISSPKSPNYVIKFASDLREVGGFFRGPPVFSTNKTGRHHITEILLKVALNIKQTNRRKRQNR
jgi:hypothetical protein